MRNSKSKLHLMATGAVWAALIVCACLLVGDASAFAQETTTDRDTTYGAGGKKITRTCKIGPVETIITEISIRDGKGVLRESYGTYVLKATGKKDVERIEYFDCNGNNTYFKEVQYNVLGNEKRYVEQGWKDGKKVYGFERTTDQNGKKTSRSYDSKLQRWEDIAFEAGPTSNEINTPPRDKTICNACKANEIVGVGQIIREDAQPNRFNTYGLTVDYARFLGSSCRVGVTGNFNADFRTRNAADSTKTSIVGGITVIPLRGATTSDKVASRRTLCLASLISVPPPAGRVKPPLCTTSGWFIEVL